MKYLKANPNYTIEQSLTGNIGQSSTVYKQEKLVPCCMTCSLCNRPFTVMVKENTTTGGVPKCYRCGGKK
jgi:hypothetical protein